MSKQFSGWLWERDLEFRDEMYRGGAPLSELLTYAGSAQAPAEIDPRKWHRQERQARNDCQGHSVSSVCESAFVAAVGRVIQFSPHWHYITSQNIDGYKTDGGSTISGGLKAAQKWGCCPLEVCPYPSRYSRTLSQAMYDAAAPYKIGSYAPMRSYADVFAWLVSGQGGINVGCGWGWFGTGSVMHTWRFANAMHATAWLGYSPRTDQQGRHYIWEANSGYPSPGYRELSPDGIDRCLADKYTVAIGMSRLSVPTPTPLLFNPLGV